jgi:TolA-binding protein
MNHSADAGVRERAAHKLAWCRFEQQNFDAAEQGFAEQIDAFPNGALAADARLMRGECQFRERKYREAFQSITASLDNATAVSSLRQSALLHAAQAAGEIEEWKRCLELADRAIAEFPDAAWLDDARCERGAALFHLRRLDEAERVFQSLTAARTPTGARAECMLGKIQASRGDSEEAVRTFFKVAYGYGDAEAPEPYRVWQAESLYEAARCLERTDRTESARKLYEELLVRFPTSTHAVEARAALQQVLQR